MRIIFLRCFYIIVCLIIVAIHTLPTNAASRSLRCGENIPVIIEHDKINKSDLKKYDYKLELNDKQAANLINNIFHDICGQESKLSPGSTPLIYKLIITDIDPSGYNNGIIYMNYIYINGQKYSNVHIGHEFVHAFQKINTKVIEVSGSYRVSKDMITEGMSSYIANKIYNIPIVQVPYLYATKTIIALSKAINNIAGNSNADSILTAANNNGTMRNTVNKYLKDYMPDNADTSDAYSFIQQNLRINQYNEHPTTIPYSPKKFYDVEKWLNNIANMKINHPKQPEIQYSSKSSIGNVANSPTSYKSDPINFKSSGALVPPFLKDLTTYGPLSSGINFSSIVLLIFRLGMAVASVGFLIVLLFGGVTYLNSGGNQETSTKARKILLAGLIGLLISLAAYGLGTMVLRVLGVVGSNSSSSSQNSTISNNTDVVPPPRRENVTFVLKTQSNATIDNASMSALLKSSNTVKGSLTSGINGNYVFNLEVPLDQYIFTIERYTEKPYYACTYTGPVSAGSNITLTPPPNYDANNKMNDIKKDCPVL